MDRSIGIFCVFQNFDICFSQNLETAKYLKSLGAKKIKFLGNLKFAESKYKEKYSFISKYKKAFRLRKIWCAASTHQDEEKMCAKSHLNIKKIHSGVLTIIIPRHIDRVNEINKELSNLDLKVVLYSDFEQVKAEF